MGQKLNKRRVSRISFSEWNSASFGAYNTGGLICENCNFHRTLIKSETRGSNYQTNNKIDRDSSCPNCDSNQHWYWLTPKARVPRKNASKSIWTLFWVKLKNREFN